jgi:hypothetical protein
MTPYLAPSLQPLAVAVVAPLIPLREITAVLAAVAALMRRLLRGRVVREIHPALRRRKEITAALLRLILMRGPAAVVAVRLPSGLLHLVVWQEMAAQAPHRQLADRRLLTLAVAVAVCKAQTKPKDQAVQVAVALEQGQFHQKMPLLARPIPAAAVVVGVKHQ